MIDTNGLMIPGQFGVDIFTELEKLGFDLLLVPRSAVRELKKLSLAGGRDGRAAKIGLSLLPRCTIIEKTGFADDLIANMAIEMKAAVLTNDVALKKRLCSKGVTIVYLRERTHLSI